MFQIPIPLVVGLIGFLGVLVGLVLRPVAEDWFSRRKKTLHVRLNEPSVFRAPHEKVLLKWENETLSRIYQLGFQLENKTGRTLRNVSLEVQAPKPAGDRDFYSVYLGEAAKCRWAEVEFDADSSLFEFEYIQPGAFVRGAMISTYTDQIEFVSHDDFEIRVVKSKNHEGIGRYLSGAFFALMLVFLTTVLVGNI